MYCNMYSLYSSIARLTSAMNSSHFKCLLTPRHVPRLTIASLISSEQSQ